MSHSSSGACGSLYGNHSALLTCSCSAMATVPKTVPTTQQHALASQTCSNAAFIVVINHYPNLIVRMQSGLAHSLKGLRSSGLEEKSPGTPERTSEKQNNCMDWSRTPKCKHTPALPESPGCLLCHSSQPQCSAFPDSTLSAPEPFTLCEDSVGYPSDLSLKSTPPPAAMLPTALYHLGDLPVDTDQA